MDQIVQQIVQRTGIPEDKARMAVGVVISHLKTRLPAPIASQLDHFVGTGAAGAAPSASGGDAGAIGTASGAAGAAAGGALGGVAGAAGLGGLAKGLGGLLDGR